LRAIFWLLDFKTESAKFRFLSWVNILSKALRNESISDDELVLFFKLDENADLVKHRANFESIIKNYYLLSFEPFKYKISDDKYLFVLKYNFLWSMNLGLKLVLKHRVFRKIKHEVKFSNVSKIDLLSLLKQHG
jgi:hypothetical protein